jgi:hypothetical protein
MNLGQNKVFERPAGGPYVGTIIDVVDMPQQITKFGPKDKVRVLWALSHTNGAPYLDKEGKPFTVAGFYNATVSENSNLTKALRQILNAQPPLLQNSNDLENLLLGRSNSLFLTQEPDSKSPGQFVTFVAGISPLPPGVAPPQAPQGFVRTKFQTKQTAGPNPGQTATTYAQPPQYQQPVAAANPFVAPPVSLSNDSF